MLGMIMASCGSVQPTVNVQATVDAQVQATLAAVKPEQQAPTPTMLASVTEPTKTSILTQVPPTALPTPIPPTPTSVPPTPVPYSGVVVFSSADDPSKLNSVLGWQPGSSPANSYDLASQPGALTLIAGPGTDARGSTFSAPAIIYPFEGNFEAQVKVESQLAQCCQLVGLGVRSTQDHATWLRNTLTFDDGHRITVAANRPEGNIYYKYEPYSGDVVYLKIERRGSVFNFSYSANGSNWVTLQKDYVFDLPADAEIFLYTYSTNRQGISAHFYDFAVFDK